jgi:DNA topoisomerase IA
MDNVEVAPPLPYSLSALLVNAALSGIGLSDGYSAAQALYLAGTISYPRSGSTELPGEGNEEFAAHSAIHTTGVLPDGTTSDTVGIYNLVQQNIQMQVLGTTMINRRTELVDVEGYMFKLHEQSLVKEGFTNLVQPWHPDFDMYQSLKKAAKREVYKKGAELIVMGMDVKKLETVVPLHFTEASMLKLMLENGIGTDATRVN